MSNIALLILAAVAGFLFYQLRSVLGQTPYDKDKRPQNPAPQSPAKDNSLYDRFKQKPDSLKDTVIDITATSADYQHKFIKTASETKRDEIIQTLNKIKIRYDSFDLHKFLDGAKGAYDMILDSFNKDLPISVKNYMSEEIYNNYRKLLDDYVQKNYHFETVVTKIDKVLIVDAFTNEATAKITVEIHAFNISCLKDSEGNILQGNPDNVTPVVDMWVFERPYSATTPAWILTSVV